MDLEALIPMDSDKPSKSIFYRKSGVGLVTVR